MILSFYTFGSPTIVLRLKMDESKSSLIEQLNETTRLAVTLTAPFAPALKIGMYTTYNGSDYYLIAEPSVTKVHSESYIIEADLESIAGLTKATILSNPIDKRTSFDYTATAREHLQLIADSLNLKLTNGGLKWAVGSVNCRNDVRHIKYDHVTTWAALQRIRETYKTDIAINGTTISLGIPSDKANALELSYGKDKGLLSGLERVKHSDTPTPSRLYVTGTKRNLVKGTLTLQPSQVLKIDDTGHIQRIVTPSSGRIYTTDTDGRYVEIYTTDTTHLRTEATYTNEEIYPSHVSKVTTVEKVRDHYEVNSDLDLDYNKQRIEGEQMQIVFQTGNLAGREFDAVYKPSTKRFAITPKEEDETTLPNDILCPKVGDRYIITGIELPQQYIAEAQKKLTDAAVTQLEELQNTRYSYKAEVDPVYLYNNRTAIADKLTVGKYVHLTDTQIAQGDPYIRITSKRTYLDRIYQPEIELSNEVEEYSFFERLKDSFSDIARIDRKEELARINRQMPDRMKEKIKGDTELQELLKGRDGKDAGRNLLLNSGDPRFQDGRCAVYELAYPIDKEGVYFLSFDVAFDKNQLYTPYGYRMKVIFGYQTALETTGYIDYYESLHDGHSRLRLNVTKNSTYQGGAKTIYIYPNEDYENPDTDPRCGKFTIKNVMLEYGTKPTVWSPAPEDFLVQLDEAKTTLTTDIGRARSKAKDAYSIAFSANKVAKSVRKEINDLRPNVPTEFEKEWVGKMGQVLKPDSEESSGLTVDRSVFLRFSDGKPSALIGGQIGKGAVLMAGVQDYGTNNQSARTEIYQDGSAKFGDVNLSDKTITLIPKKGLPLRVTAEEGSFIENFLANSKDDRYIAYEKSFVVVGKGEVQTYSFDVANNDTKLTITIPKLTSEVYQINQSVILTLDGVTLGSWHGDTKLIREDTSGIVGGGVHFRKENTPLVVENLQFERYLSSGSHTLSVSVTSTDTRDKATITKLTAHLYYDASQAETILTHKGFRAFGGQNRYFDIDWRWTYRAKGYFTTSNPYIARVKGGMRVDSLTLEQPLDAPGCVLAGGRVENGYVNASFGKYKNKRNDSIPRARFDNDDKIYGVFHSIGNTNYTPIVTSCAGAWGDVPQVIGVYEYRFDVRFINYNNEPSVGWNFNYVCYKGD